MYISYSQGYLSQRPLPPAPKGGKRNYLGVGFLTFLALLALGACNFWGS